MPDLGRREFLKTLTAASAASVVMQSEEPARLVDIHQHTHYEGRTDEQLLAHQAAHHVTETILLPGEGWMLSIVGDNATCAALEAKYPDRFRRFACSDPAESRTADLLTGNIHRGAIGIGELKFHVAVDSPEMHRVYKLAEDLRVPVLIHFEYETYNTGLERFPKILKQYPKVNFIGHAQTWWGNISAELNPLNMYPQGPVKPGGLTDRLLSDYENVYGDLSAGSGLNALTRDAGFARGFLERHARKLVWGSDCPCHDGRGGGTMDGYCIAARALAALEELVPDAKLRGQFLYENAQILLRL
jgi:predicted TIM-barrel fold metal-dependent hydrolase